jgi:uncharacterized protein (TIGR02284 family)
MMEGVMVTTAGTESTLEDLLRDLIQLEHDAKDAYQAAIDRLENADFRTQLAAFREDHLRHIEELGGLMAEMGREPPKQGDMKSLLTKGKVVLAGLVGDKAILLAMKTNEDDTNTAYERATQNDAPPEAHAVFERALEDERRHRDWIAATLDRL